jgi:hypothetical protein
MTSEESLAAGVAMLAPLLERNGFMYVPLAAGASSAGQYASGEFRRERPADLRRLEVHFRSSLGLLTYDVDQRALSHDDYMRALGVRGAYPGFSTDPLDGFRHLLKDLQAHAAGFLTGPKADFARCADAADRRNASSGFKRLSEIPGSDGPPSGSTAVS